MPEAIEKVAAFITRETKDGLELLLFKHPYAYNQLPAGTVEPGETPEAAVLREAFEETGLEPLSIREYLGCEEVQLPDGNRVILTSTRVFARPDITSLRLGLFASRRPGYYTQNNSWVFPGYI